MSGHNKWSTIKHKKGKEDAKRGKIFTKLIKEIMVAARMGGGDPNGNPRLRSAVSAARGANMPVDNITRAIKKGTGELEGVNYESLNYEGYGPGGAAVIVEVLTDNKNRTVAEVRHIFSKHNGSLAETGAVGWMFDTKGLIQVERTTEEGKDIDEEELLLAAIDAGAEDLQTDDDEVFEVYTAATDLDIVRQALEDAGYPLREFELARVPQNMVTLEGKQAEQVMKLLDALDDCDDVQKLLANVEFEDEDGED